MKFFAAILPMKDKELSEKHRPAHLAFLEKLHAEGTIAAYGRFADGAGGLIIYRVDSYETAEGYVKQDPFVIEGARNYEIHEWSMVSNEWS
ncbi:YciI family protein [Alteribacillus sp. HJP-4]|uniref:YciI family protein n=1 Tax=Alteribacillus sp. HJP-4 TaxID=2775394 RepID=UPI0035CD1CC1